MTVERSRDAPRPPRPSLVVPTLHAARVTLRPIKAADAPTLFGLFSDGEVTRYWSRPPMTDPGEAQRLVRDIRAGYRSGESMQFGIEQRSDRALVGTCTLFHFHPGSRRAEIGYALGAAYWGHGLMHEALQRLLRYAFDDLGLHRLEADIDPRNTASARSLARLGFIKEGYLRERWIVAGRDLRHRALRTAQARVGAGGRRADRPPMIRCATPADAAGICRIYNPYVQDTVISFEETPVPVPAMAARIEEVLRTHPWHVAESRRRSHGLRLCLALAIARGVPARGRNDGLRRAAACGPGARPCALRRAAAGPHATRLPLRDGRHRVAEPGEHRAARKHGVRRSRSLSRGRLEVRPLDRRGLLATASDNARTAVRRLDLVRARAVLYNPVGQGLARANALSALCPRSHGQYLRLPLRRDAVSHQRGDLGLHLGNALRRPVLGGRGRLVPVPSEVVEVLARAAAETIRLNHRSDKVADATASSAAAAANSAVISVSLRSSANLVLSSS